MGPGVQGSLLRNVELRTFILLLALAAGGARADVFMRLGRGAQAMEQLGGSAVFRSDVRINGQPGTLAVYGFDRPPPNLAARLGQALSMPDLASAGASLLTRVADGHATSLLLLPGSGSDTCLAMLIDRTEAAYIKSRTAPANWPGGLACPNAELQFSAENDKTHTALAIAALPGKPEAAISAMESVLIADGWTRSKPAVPGASLAMFTRHNRVCAVCATEDTATHRTRLTILQRLGATFASRNE